MYIIDNKQNYGIFYTSGATLNDLVKIQMVKSIIQYLCSLVVSFAVLLMIIYTFDAQLKLRGAVGMSELLFWTIKVRVIPITIACSLLLSVLASVTPIIIISKKSPYEMMKED